MPGTFSKRRLASLVRCHAFDLGFDLVDLQLQLLEMSEQPVDEQPEGARQFDRRILDELGHALGDVGDPLRYNQPVLAKQSADLVGLCGSRSDEALANAVQCKDRLLFHILDRTKRIDGRDTASQIASASAELMTRQVEAAEMAAIAAARCH